MARRQAADGRVIADLKRPFLLRRAEKSADPIRDLKGLKMMSAAHHLGCLDLTSSRLTAVAAAGNCQHVGSGQLLTNH